MLLYISPNGFPGIPAALLGLPFFGRLIPYVLCIVNIGMKSIASG
jgi:hypothetical protein